VEKAFDKITAWTNAAEEVEGIDLLVSNAASPVRSVVRSKNWSLRNGRRGKTAM
jgi:hypothetical protein